MSERYRRYTNLFGHQVEFASEIFLPYEMHFRRESKSQKAQVDSGQKPGHSKGRKMPIKDKR